MPGRVLHLMKFGSSKAPDKVLARLKSDISSFPHRSGVGPRPDALFGREGCHIDVRRLLDLVVEQVRLRRLLDLLIVLEHSLHRENHAYACGDVEREALEVMKPSRGTAVDYRRTTTAAAEKAVSVPVTLFSRHCDPRGRPMLL